VHASLLPRWRGAAPIQRAIEAGDRETGVTIMQMDEGLDTGDMLASASCPIRADTTAASLHDELGALGAPLLLEVLDDLPGHQRRALQQDGDQANYAHKILKTEAEINWARDSVYLDLAIRAFNPFPVCFTTLSGERIKIWQAQPVPGAADPVPPGTILKADREGILVSCGKGQLKIQRLQLPGGKPLSAQQVLNSRSELLSPGQVFSSPHPGDA
jgi:methionyl-tRNA formyltransferase